LKTYNNLLSLDGCKYPIVKSTILSYFEIEELGCIKDIDPEQFNRQFGGSVYEIENFEDLKEVTIYDLDSEVDKSLFDSVGCFDIVRLVAEDMLLIVNITNNNGGPSYFIQKEFWNESIKEMLTLDTESQ
jgi:hypothetical protein